jgi:hypothetical protein
MAEQFQEDKGQMAVLKRRGFPIYQTNPSVGSFPVRIKRSDVKAGQSVYMVAPGSGDVIGRGAFGFVEEKEVDSEEFVKVYLEGLRKYGELKRAGALIFEFVYRELSGKEAKDKDTIMLNYLLANRWKPDLTERTYFRGMNELLAKEFLYRTMAADVYFVNVRFMFNGDRLILAKSYRRKQPKEMIQEELPLEGTVALPASAASAG